MQVHDSERCRLFADSFATALEFVLDDALRDGELAIARRWASPPYPEIEGIRLIEKGLHWG